MDTLNLSDLSSTTDIIKGKEIKYSGFTVINLTSLWVLPHFKKEVKSKDFKVKFDKTELILNFNLSRKYIKVKKKEKIYVKNGKKVEDNQLSMILGSDIDSSSSEESESEESSSDESISEDSDYEEINEKDFSNNSEEHKQLLNLQTNLDFDQFRYPLIQIMCQSHIFNTKNLKSVDFIEDLAESNINFKSQKVLYPNFIIENESESLLGQSNLIKVISYMSIKVKNKFKNSLSSLSNIVQQMETADIIKKDLTYLREHNQDFKKLINDHKYHDFTIVVDQKRKIKVHKAILAIHSPVFSNMFLEKRKIIEINDVSYDTMMQLMTFIYCGELDNFNLEKALILLPVSDKFKIDRLHQVCQNIIIDSVTYENAFDTVLLADENNATLIKDYCLSFIVKNLKKFKGKDFQNLVDKNSKLLGEIMDRNANS